ncbi:MAG: FAD-binding protein [Gammaproteobacteria bacterium]
MSVLILAEHDGQQLNPGVYRAVSAARFWELPVHLLVTGGNTANIAELAAAIAGVQRVICLDSTHLVHPLAEDVANIIAVLGQQYRVILAAHGAFSKNILPRAAALLDVAMISDVLEIKADNTYVRSIYAGSVHSIIRSIDPIQVLTVHGSSFPVANSGGHAEIINLDVPAPIDKTRWLSENHSQSEHPALNSASVVVAGGRSLGSAENFEALLAPLAAKLGAAMGATRAAVDAGYAPNEMQVGQTGIVVAPELYIAIGVSGAVQHTFGMKDSKLIVAINQDPDAPIFQVADYGLVADLFEAVPALAAAIIQREKDQL